MHERMVTLGNEHSEGVNSNLGKTPSFKLISIYCYNFPCAFGVYLALETWSLQIQHSQWISNL